ncbi:MULTISPECIES: 3-methyl-2-oxobutanoate hydroxymethyltransferase [Hyphomicrobiales]|uniref:3-methyl-2-oxobutanoate hydroxymethyltransferase n=1 Tax=Hyphomicrobiales TaxID=356 RepID=UPI00039EC31A|nr:MULTISPECIES: 3-methyl-2-oxobutanoate hydroxymethyltransferase [Phyllobacteriaceae]MCX8568178.1 3-methyl-2-oxobutanoate hydroxymethyltransferase [Aminobacter sp. MET-1]
MASDAPAAAGRITPAELMARKGGQPIVCLTAYTYPIARLLDPHVDLLLVGDSVAMVLHGHANTLGATMDMMIAHGQAVMRGASRACIVVDMPAGSYEDSVETAVASARRIVQETGCDAIKLEGGVAMAPQIAAIVAAGIPVMGHIGLLPQSVEKEGGYKIKGRSEANAEALYVDAKAVEAAGAFSTVIEGTIEPVAAEITRRIAIPTIGIGASAACDGQVLVTDDAIGLTVDRVPKFVKEYAHLRDIVAAAAAAYASDVRSRTFPAPEHLFAPNAPALKPQTVLGKHDAQIDKTPKDKP